MGRAVVLAVAADAEPFERRSSVEGGTLVTLALQQILILNIPDVAQSIARVTLTFAQIFCLAILQIRLSFSEFLGHCIAHTIAVVERRARSVPLTFLGEMERPTHSRFGGRISGFLCGSTVFVELPPLCLVLLAYLVVGGVSCRIQSR